MNPFFGILLVIGLAMGELMGRFHRTGELSFQQKEIQYKCNEIKAEQLNGVDNPKDSRIKIL